MFKSPAMQVVGSKTCDLVASSWSSFIVMVLFTWECVFLGCVDEGAKSTLGVIASNGQALRVGRPETVSDVMWAPIGGCVWERGSWHYL